MFPAAHVMWWTSPDLLREFRTASNKRPRPRNEAKGDEGTVFLLKIRRKINFSRQNSWRLKCKFATGKPKCQIIGSAVWVRVVSSHSVALSFTWCQIKASVDHAVNSACQDRCGCWLLYVRMHRQQSPASYEGCRIDIRLLLRPSLFRCSRQEEEGYRCT